MPCVDISSSFAFFMIGCFTTTLHPHTFRLLKFGLIPVSDSYGDIFILNLVCGILFITYTACINAYDQNSEPSPALYNIPRMSRPKVLLGASAIPFCFGLPAPVGSKRNPAFVTTSLNSALAHNSPP